MSGVLIINLTLQEPPWVQDFHNLDHFYFQKLIYCLHAGPHAMGTISYFNCGYVIERWLGHRSTFEINSLNWK